MVFKWNLHTGASKLMLNIPKNEIIDFHTAYFNLQPSAWHKKFDLKSKKCYYGAWERRFCTRYLLVTPSNLLCGTYFPPSFHGVKCISRRRDRLKKFLGSSYGGYSCEAVSVYEIQFTIVICSCDQTVRIWNMNWGKHQVLHPYIFLAAYNPGMFLLQKRQYWRWSDGWIGFRWLAWRWLGCGSSATFSATFAGSRSTFSTTFAAITSSSSR